MFNPKEAAEDRYALNLAILFFAACAVLISVYFHHDSGLKYWLLTGFGETSEGTILSVQDAPKDWNSLEAVARQSPRNSLKNFGAWTSGDLLVAEFKPEGDHLLILTFKMPANFAGNQIADSLFITYLPINPRIAYPTDYLADFSFDGKILLWSFIIGVIVVLLAARSIQKWSSFRNRLRRY